MAWRPNLGKALRIWTFELRDGKLEQLKVAPAISYDVLIGKRTAY